MGCCGNSPFANATPMRMAVLLLLLVAAPSGVLTQTPAPPMTLGPTFDVVSIKRHLERTPGSRMNQRPDGGMMLVNVPVSFLIGQAYPGALPIDMVGLPEW